jgi:excisionase family DNA binding protein
MLHRTIPAGSPATVEVTLDPHASARSGRDYAAAYLDAGLSVIPIKPDGTKAPRGKWKPCQTRRMTTAEVAALLGVSVLKVRAWIEAGELRAVNGATRVGGRPRWLVDPAALAEFEAARASHKPAPTTTTRRRKPAGVTSYF